MVNVHFSSFQRAHHIDSLRTGLGESGWGRGRRNKLLNRDHITPWSAENILELYVSSNMVMILPCIYLGLAKLLYSELPIIYHKTAPEKLHVSVIWAPVSVAWTNGTWYLFSLWFVMGPDSVNKADSLNFVCLYWCKPLYSKKS